MHSPLREPSSCGPPARRIYFRFGHGREISVVPLNTAPLGSATRTTSSKPGQRSCLEASNEESRKGRRFVMTCSATAFEFSSANDGKMQDESHLVWRIQSGSEVNSFFMFRSDCCRCQSNFPVLVLLSLRTPQRIFTLPLFRLDFFFLLHLHVFRRLAVWPPGLASTGVEEMLPVR
jgi:hypothetical protein